jgi:hypothetical protein
MFLAAIAVWVVIVSMLSKRIPRWLGVTRFKKSIGVVSFVVLLLLPIADDIIGQLQFNRLCKREAVFDLKPIWAEVTRAGMTSVPLLPGEYIVPIHGTRYEYFDLDNQNIFFTLTRFSRKPGILRKMLWDGGFSNNDFCVPGSVYEIYRKINLDQLLRNGENK